MRKVLYFSAGWCGPCKQLAPVMESLKGQINYEKIDVDSNTELAAKYGVRNIPTLLFIQNDVVYNKLVGNQTDTSILNAYNG